MTPGRILATVGAAATLTLAAAGCGLGAGPKSDGQARLSVTRDYGEESLLAATVSDPAASETVIRMLDREARMTTRYGGGFVQSIEGLQGTVADDRSLDWFFYVNGVESPVGAAEVQVRAGDRIWWDYRDWMQAMRVPAVISSWPEPFAQGSAPGEPLPVQVACATRRTSCDQVARQLATEGVDVSVEPTSGKEEGGEGEAEALRLLVGPWARIRADPAAALLDDGPSVSGVFARPRDVAGHGYELVALDQRAEPAVELAEGDGLVAAVRDGERPPTWLVTAGEAEGMDAAVAMLEGEALTDRYAVASVDGEPVSVPVGPAIGGVR